MTRLQVPTRTPRARPIEVRRVPANGIELNVAMCGQGPAVLVLLLHGWPHTWQL